MSTYSLLRTAQFFGLLFLLIASQGCGRNIRLEVNGRYSVEEPVGSNGQASALVAPTSTQGSQGRPVSFTVSSIPRNGNCQTRLENQKRFLEVLRTESVDNMYGEKELAEKISISRSSAGGYRRELGIPGMHDRRALYIKGVTDIVQCVYDYEEGCRERLKKVLPRLTVSPNFMPQQDIADLTKEIRGNNTSSSSSADGAVDHPQFPVRPHRTPAAESEEKSLPNQGVSVISTPNDCLFNRLNYLYRSSHARTVPRDYLIVTIIKKYVEAGYVDITNPKIVEELKACGVEEDQKNIAKRRGKLQLTKVDLSKLASKSATLKAMENYFTTFQGVKPNNVATLHPQHPESSPIPARGEQGSRRVAVPMDAQPGGMFIREPAAVSLPCLTHLMGQGRRVVAVQQAAVPMDAQPGGMFIGESAAVRPLVVDSFGKSPLCFPIRPRVSQGQKRPAAAVSEQERNSQNRPPLPPHDPPAMPKRQRTDNDTTSIEEKLKLADAFCEAAKVFEGVSQLEHVLINYRKAVTHYEQALSEMRLCSEELSDIYRKISEIYSKMRDCAQREGKYRDAEQYSSRNHEYYTKYSQMTQALRNAR